MTTQTVHVVLFDPSGVVPEGFVVPNYLKLAELHAHGCLTLPVDDDLVPGKTMDPQDGFVVKTWGQGWTFDRGAGERGCPMLLRVLPLRGFIHWMACLAPIAERDMQGQIRLVTDSANPVYASQGLHPILTPPAFRGSSKERGRGGGGVIRGLCQVSVSTESLLALNLYAIAKGCRVLWSAVSHCSSKQP